MTIKKITDLARIAQMGVMATPAITVDNVVKFAGKVLTKERIKQLIQEAGE